jgi:hypothetical protein
MRVMGCGVKAVDARDGLRRKGEGRPTLRAERHVRLGDVGELLCEGRRARPRREAGVRVGPEQSPHVVAEFEGALECTM